MGTATVVIPTTGLDTLDLAIQSVRQQNYANTRCLVVIDGPQFAVAARRITAQYTNVNVLALPENVGADNFYGHRIYAAAGFLVNTDYILYLDQDNWMDPDHVSSMVDKIERENLDWCYSLRKIYDRKGEYQLDDNCESLGKWPAWMNDQVFLIDTSCYCIKREVATKISGAWYGKWGQDRVFMANANHFFPKWGCTGKHSLNYRLDGNQGSVNKDFFIQGNNAMLEKYPMGFPWLA